MGSCYQIGKRENLLRGLLENKKKKITVKKKNKKFQGTVKQLQDLTGWSGHQVLYFGDHPYSDLADVTLEHGWRTGAIIHELTVQKITIIFFNPNFNKKNCFYPLSMKSTH